MPRAPPRAHEWEMKRSRSGAVEEKRDLFFPPPHTCKQLISLLHYQASAAGTGFNSSSIYHWATTMVNLDYLLYLLPNPSITSTRLVQQPGNLISPKSWPGGFTQNLLSWEETELLDNLCASLGGFERLGDRRGGMFTRRDTYGMKDNQRFVYGIRFMTTVI